MATDLDIQRKSLILLRTLTEISMRYHQKASAVVQSVAFLLTADEIGATEPRLKRAIERFEQYLAPHSLDYLSHFYGLLLISLVSEIEVFLADTVNALIRFHPEKIGSATFSLSRILESTTDDLIAFAAEAHIRDLLYERPSTYFDKMANLIGVRSRYLKPYWPTYVEAKARRDLGVHNSWLVNETYLRKATEAGIEPQCQVGALLVPDDKYFSDVHDALTALVNTIYNELKKKYSGGLVD